MKLEGIHHISAITSDAQRNVDFYAGLLGLRLVKKSVNQDQTSVYHLFYGDEQGDPGADLTFFEYPGLPRGRAGAGMVHRIVWRVASPEALDFWSDRLAAAAYESTRSGQASLRFADWEGLEHELLVVSVPDEPLIANHPEIPAALALQGFHAVRAFSAAPDRSRPLLEETLGLEARGAGEWEARGDLRGGSIHYDSPPELRPLQGAGTVHHVAWATYMEDQDAWQRRMVEAGAHATPVIDRYYFRSIYFREPSGVLFELATMGPGFTVDEPLDRLGEKLSLTPQFEHLRESIEPRLTPLRNPREAWARRSPGSRPVQKARSPRRDEESLPSGPYANVCSCMAPPIVVAALVPRLQLTVAAGDRAELLRMPAALAPEPGGPQQVGEVSPAAGAFGIHPGMRLGEALARCPRLVLVPPDPAGAADFWETKLAALESVGAAVEPVRPGLACFDAAGLLRMHAGRLGLVLAAARRALGVPARFGVAPTRFAAVAAATQARVRRPVIVDGGERQAREFLAPLPVALLRGRSELSDLPDSLERLGIGTLGELAALPTAAVVDRFGSRGRVAHGLASGRDTRLRPREASELVRESLDLPEAASGPQLERALGLLIDRVLARPERRGRTLRSVVLSAVLVERGGTWREPFTFREALGDPLRMRLALAPRLALIPAPAQALQLTVERFGPATGDQRGLLDDPAEARLARLREAIRQTRAAAGPDAALRILEVDPASRFPERRSVLTPYEG